MSFAFLAHSPLLQGPAPLMAAEAMACFGHLSFASAQGVRALLEADHMHELRHVVQHQVAAKWLLESCLKYNLVKSTQLLRGQEMPRGAKKSF